MNYVILDLEWNSSYSKKNNKFVNEIIEFGAVKTDEELNVISTFSMLVTPQIQKKLNSHVRQLTHITNEELKQSNNTFTHVLSKFKKFLGDSVLMTWGTSDILTLIDNIRYYLGEERMPFITKYCNLQHYCEKMLGHSDKSKQLGLSPCAEKLGIQPDDIELHRAYNDALLSLQCFKKLYDADAVLDDTVAADDEFYRKVTFKNTIICDIKNPLIDKRELYVCCDSCGKKAIRATKWTVKNKSFRAGFYCPKCRRELDGRVVFRLKYDGVTVDRRAVEVPRPDKKSPKPDTAPQKQSKKASADLRASGAAADKKPTLLDIFYKKSKPTDQDL